MDMLALRWMSLRLKTVRWEEVHPTPPSRSTESETPPQGKADFCGRVADAMG
jgi:hypothetical protein